MAESLPAPHAVSRRAAGRYECDSRPGGIPRAPKAKTRAARRALAKCVIGRFTAVSFPEFLHLLRAYCESRSLLNTESSLYEFECHAIALAYGKIFFAIDVAEPQRRRQRPHPFRVIFCVARV